jgi:hypothetical protein
MYRDRQARLLLQNAQKRLNHKEFYYGYSLVLEHALLQQTLPNCIGESLPFASAIEDVRGEEGRAVEVSWGNDAHQVLLVCKHQDCAVAHQRILHNRLQITLTVKTP